MVTTAPVSPSGAIFGVKLDPFETPLTSVGLPCRRNTGEGITVIENAVEDPLANDAVRIAFWDACTEAAVATKLVLMPPAGIEAVLGTVIDVFCTDRAIDVGFTAAAVKLAVQVVVALENTAASAH